MPTYTGQLGTPLEITLSSILLGCRWSQSEAVAGGQVSLLIHIGYAGDGNPVEYTVFKEGGSKIAQLKGKTVAGLASVKWTLPENVSGKFMFVAEAKDIDIVGRSDTLTVLANAGIGPVTATDPEDKALEEIFLGKRMRWVCRLPGVPDGTIFQWRIQCHQDAAHQTTAALGQGAAKKSEGEVLWESRYPFEQSDKKHQKELDKTSETYKDAVFQATFTCLGVTVRSAEVKVRTTAIVQMEGTKRAYSTIPPDGTKKDQDTSQDPVVEFEAPGVGTSELLPSEGGH